VCGVPTLISKRMNIAPDLARHRAAITVELSVRSIHEAMRQLMEAPDDRRALASRGRAWASTHCSVASVGRQFRDFYEAVARA